MAGSRGRGGGFVGLIDLKINDDPSLTGIAFNADILAHTGQWQARPIDRTGRGSAGVSKYRLADDRFTFSVPSCRFRWDGPPIPASIKHCYGTITQVLENDPEEGGAGVCTLATPVKVTKCDFAHVEEGEGASDLWTGSLAGVQNGPQVLTWNGVRMTFNPPAYNTQETYKGLGKRYDPCDLETAAVQRIDVEGLEDNDPAEVTAIRNLVASAVAPITGLKIVTADFSKGEEGDDSTGGAIVINWGLSNTQDQIELPGTSSGYYALRGDTATITTVEDCPGNVDSYTEQAWENFQGIANAIGIQGVKRTPSKAIVRRLFDNAGIIVAENTSLKPRYVAAKMDTDGKVKVYISQARQVGTNLWKVLLGKALVNQPLRLITIAKNSQASTFATAPTYWNLLGLTNAAVWEGIEVGGLRYIGPSGKLRYDLKNKRTCKYLFHFVRDFNGLFDLVGYHTRWFPSSVAVATGDWVDISSTRTAFGAGNGLYATIPARGDFSVFLGNANANPLQDWLQSNANAGFAGAPPGSW